MSEQARIYKIVPAVDDLQQQDLRRGVIAICWESKILMPYHIICGHCTRLMRYCTMMMRLLIISSPPGHHISRHFIVIMAGYYVIYRLHVVDSSHIRHQSPQHKSLPSPSSIVRHRSLIPMPILKGPTIQRSGGVTSRRRCLALGSSSLCNAAASSRCRGSACT